MPGKFPVIHVYASMYNEAALLPFFLEHYSLLAERIYLYDNHSTDESVLLAARNSNVCVRKIDTNGRLSEQALQMVRNEAWQASRGKADWIMLVDIDEFLHHRNWSGFFTRLDIDGSTVVRATGWAMVSREFPQSGRSLVEQCQLGVRDRYYSKPTLFRPDAIAEMNYLPGGHSAMPIGNVRWWSSRYLQLLHYKYLGLDYFLQRRREFRLRLDPDDLALGLNVHINHSDEVHINDFNQHLTTAEFCIYKETKI